MASKSLGTLTIDLVAKTAGFVQGMDKAERSSAKFRKKVEKDLKAAGDMIGKTFVAATAAAATALIGLTKQSLDAVDANAKLARSLAASYTGLKAIGFAMEEAGVDGFEQSLAAMNQRLGQAERGTGKAAKAVEELGLNLQYMTTLDADEKIAYIADAIKNAGVSMQQAASYAKDLGFTQESAAGFFSKGGNAIRGYRQEIERMGLALNAIETDRIEAANDAMGRVGKAATGLGNTLAVQLSPWLKNFSGGLELLIIDLGSFIEKFSDAVDIWERAKGDESSYQSALKNKEIANEVQILTKQRLKLKEEIARAEGTALERSGRIMKNKERVVEIEKRLHDITNARIEAEKAHSQRMKSIPVPMIFPTVTWKEGKKTDNDPFGMLNKNSALDDIGSTGVEGNADLLMYGMPKEQLLGSLREDIKSITRIRMEGEEELTALLAEESKKRREEQMAANMATLDNYENLFASLHGLSEAFGKENSKTARAMFALSKAAAVAKAMLAISASAEALGDHAIKTEQRVAHAATIASAVAGIVASVKGVKMQGMAHDGIDSVPKTGTWLLEKGERVMTSETSAKLDKKLDTMGGRYKIVNVIDPRMVADYLSTDSGEELVMNIIGRNQSAIAAYARG